jgi:acyl carrier protein
MGLDSVTLVVDVEKHFDILIPNGEAEKIYTVQDFADCVFTKVTVNPSHRCRSQILLYRLRSFFVDKLGVDRKEIHPDRKLKDLIHIDELKGTWAQIEEYLLVKLPDLSQLDFDRTIGKEIRFLGLKFWTRKTPVTDGTIGDLVNWTLSLNHTKFIDPRNLCSKADIERIITGIISESCGIPVDEIKLEHGIVNDLGLD